MTSIANKDEVSIIKEASSDRTQEETPPTTDKKPSIPIHRLFRYADKRDTLMICLAILCSTTVGALQPASIIIFGNFLDKLTLTIADPSTDYIAATLPVILVLVYMATAVLIASYAAQTLWIIAGEK
jgi:hypothetical protein